MNTARSAYNAWRKGHEVESGGGWPDWDKLAPPTQARWVNAVHTVRLAKQISRDIGLLLIGGACGILITIGLLWLAILLT